MQIGEVTEQKSSALDEISKVAKQREEAKRNARINSENVKQRQQQFRQSTRILKGNESGETTGGNKTDRLEKKNNSGMWGNTTGESYLWGNTKDADDLMEKLNKMSEQSKK